MLARLEHDEAARHARLTPPAPSADDDFEVVWSGTDGSLAKVRA